MKRMLFVSAVAAALSAACSNGPGTVDKPQWFTNETYFEEKNGMYEEMPVFRNNIVMVGDDYIDRGIWNEFFGDTTFKNRGITYDATEHVLYRIDGIAAQKPAKIFVSVGRNDVLHGTPAETVVGNIEAIFSRIHKLSPETECYWLNIVGGTALYAGQAAAADSINAEMKNREAKGGFSVVDLAAVLDAKIADGTYSWDGGKLLNGAGYEALAQAIEAEAGKPHLNRADDRNDPLEVSDYYRHRVSLFRSLPETENKIVMLGNSLNNNALWTELFPFGNLVNRGISGDVIDGMTQRLDEIVADAPVKIFLQTGANDLVNDPDLSVVEAWNRYERLLRAITEQLPDTKLYVQSILPVNPKSPYYAGFNERAAEINKLLDAAQERYGYVYLDIASLLSDENGDLGAQYTTDGLHLSATGYFIWAAELAKGTRMMIHF